MSNQDIHCLLLECSINICKQKSTTKRPLNQICDRPTDEGRHVGGLSILLYFFQDLKATLKSIRKILIYMKFRDQIKVACQVNKG